MTSINDLITNYTELLNNQNNSFDCKISNKSFLIISEFISEYIEPPLLLIKDEYNIIEEKLLNIILELVRAFPDYYSVVKNVLNLEYKSSSLNSLLNWHLLKSNSKHLSK